MAYRLRAVCIDDDPAALELVRSSAEDQDDIEIIDTATETAWVSPLLRRHRPDVLILDHGFADAGPVIDLRNGHRGGRASLGLQLVDLAHELVPGLIVVLFTAWDGLETAAHNVGVDVLVHKPDVDGIWTGIRQLRAARHR